MDSPARRRHLPSGPHATVAHRTRRHAPAPPYGQTPVPEADGGHREKVSVIGGISVLPTDRRLGFDFATEPDGYDTAKKVAGYLRDLVKHLRGNVVVVRDRGPNYTREAIRRFLSRSRRRRSERLPAWAPDHNPEEAVWSWWTSGERANFAPADRKHLDDDIVARRIELKLAPERLQAMWDRCKRPFPTSDVQ